MMALAVMSATPAAAATIAIDFEGIAGGVLVNDYYNGGAASDGTRTFNSGVQFVNFRTVQNIGTPASTIAFNNAARALVNTLFGFTSLGFDYGFRSTGTVNVFAGRNGTGTLLGTATFVANTPVAASPFSAGSVTFSGPAQSFTLTGTNGTLALDNIVFGIGTSAAVPEPASWALMIAGFGAVGTIMRRRRTGHSAVRFVLADRPLAQS